MIALQFSVGDKFSLNDMKVLSFYQLRRLITTENVVDVYCDAIQKLPHLGEFLTLVISYFHFSKSSTLYLNSFML